VFFPVQPGRWPGARTENNMTVTTSWDLFEDMRAAQDELLRLTAGRNGRLAQRDGASGAPVWTPAIDIYERRDAYLVAVEIPGATPDEIEITFQDGLLTIQGDRHVATEASAEQVHRSERQHGAFRRSITMPRDVEADKIEASAQDGVLEIMVPKPREVRGKRIQVRPGDRHPARTPGAAASNGS
jgi:HSP20 family protein